MAKQTKLFTMILAAALLSGGIPGSGWLSTRAEAADESARGIFAELYGDEVKRVSVTRETTDDVALAKSLLKAVETAKEQATLVEVFCDNAYLLASRDNTAVGFDTAVEAMETLAKYVPAKAAEANEKIITTLRSKYMRSTDAEKTAAGEALIDRYFASAEQFIASSDYAAAAKEYQRAHVIARQIESPRMATIEAKQDEARQREEVARRISLLQDRIAKDSSNAALRKELVLLYVVDLDDLAAAMPHAGGSGDEDLKRFVPLAAKGDAVPADASLDLGDWYYKLSNDVSGNESKRRLLEHASDHLARFLSDATNASGIQKAKATLTLNRVKLTLEKLKPTAVAVNSNGNPSTNPNIKTPTRPKTPTKPGKPIDLLKGVETTKDVVMGKWEKSGSRVGATVEGSDQEAWINTPMQPDGDYEVTFKFTKTAGRAVVKVYMPLPFAKGSSSSSPEGISATFGANDGKFSMFERGKGSSYYYSYDDASAYNNPTIQGAVRFTNGKTYSIKVTVKNNDGEVEATAYLSGRKFLAWKGKPSTLPGYSYSSKIDAKAVGFAVYNTTQRSAAVFSSASIRTLSGEVKDLSEK